MDEFDPFLAPLQKDKLTPAEYLAREHALQQLMVEAIERHDEDRLEAFKDALDELARDNPAKGANHSLATCPETVPVSRNSIRRLGKRSLQPLLGNRRK